MTNKLLLSVVCVALFASCTMRFTHPTKDSQGDFKRDWNDCRVKANQAGAMTQYGPTKQFMQECMEGQGWTRVE